MTHNDATKSLPHKALVKHMVDRFLGWRLPENFSPDAGISFDPVFNKGTQYEHRHEPIGTNLLDATQAEAMVRYMLDGLPHASLPASEPMELGEFLGKTLGEALPASGEDEVERIFAALDAMGEALMHAHFALDDSEERDGEDGPHNLVPHENVIALDTALRRCEEFEGDFAEPNTVWEGPGPLPRCLKSAIAALRPNMGEVLEVLEQAQSDLDFLRLAIEKDDPKGELLVRVTDIWKRHDATLAKYGGGK